MIQNEAQLQQACDALGDLYRVLGSYRSRILPQNARNYAMMAQGPLEQIRKLQSEIEEYLGLTSEAAMPVGPGTVLREKPGS